LSISAEWYRVDLKLWIYIASQYDVAMNGPFSDLHGKSAVQALGEVVGSEVELV